MPRGHILNDISLFLYRTHRRSPYHDKSEDQGYRMKKIEAIVRPEKISRIKSELLKLGISGMTLSDVSGWSKGRELHLQWRGQKIAYDLVPKIKIEVVTPDSFVDKIVECIVEQGKTDKGQEGDGVIFISSIEDAINIATSLRGERAIVHSK